MDLTFNPGHSIGQGGMCFMFHCINHPSQQDRKAKCKDCLRIHGRDTHFQEVLVNKNINKRHNTKRRK